MLGRIGLHCCCCLCCFCCCTLFIEQGGRYEGGGGMQDHPHAAHRAHHQAHFLSLALAQQHIGMTPRITHTRQPSLCYKTTSPQTFSACSGYKNTSRSSYTASTYLCKRDWCRSKYQLHHHQKGRANYSARDLRRILQALQRLAAQCANLQEWQQACSHRERNCCASRLILFAGGEKRTRGRRDAEREKGG